MEASISPVARLRGVFVTGTGTSVGKSVLSAAICAALAARGDTVAAFKPVITGLDEAGGDWPLDDELLAGAASAGQKPEDVSPHRFGPPVSPHLAAELAGETIEPLAIAREARELAEKADALVCEGVGGLMVPLAAGFLVRDLAVELDVPLVIASPPGLGAINHCLLTIEAARAAGLTVAAVVLTPWPDDPDHIERSNRDTIATLGDVKVCVLPPTTPDKLAEAGAELPVEDWLEVAEHQPHDIAGMED
ncbi:MAG: dethiobiotin synthetase [Thermoleophilaceae bacterium]|jgi:dethiobiotin synthetase|nr:dethiobiotin synthetase [Thermoleophilaceae bacterium]